MASVPKRSILGRKCVLKIFGYPYFNGNVKNINSINQHYLCKRCSLFESFHRIFLFIIVSGLQYCIIVNFN